MTSLWGKWIFCKKLHHLPLQKRCHPTECRIYRAPLGGRAVPDLPIGYMGLSLRPQVPRGPPKTVVRIESYSTFVVIMPESSNELPWISMWRLVKPHANYCVDILKARWLRPAFAELYRLLRVTLSKEALAVHVWNAPDQWHNWQVERVRTASPCQAKCKNLAPT